MNEEIDRINETLPNVRAREKTEAILLWIRSILRRFEHYKAEHRQMVKVAMTLLELALWKAKLDDFTIEDDKCSAEEKTAKKAKIDDECARREARITSGADIIIKNVLPYLKME